MLIKVFGIWFDPAGIKLEAVGEHITKIIGSGWTIELLLGTPDEVAEKINEQIKEQRR